MADAAQSLWPGGPSSMLGNAELERPQYPGINEEDYNNWLHNSGTDDMWYEPKKHGSLEEAVEKYPNGLLLEKGDVPGKAPPGTQIYTLPWNDDPKRGTQDGRKFIRKIQEVPVS